MCPVRITGKGSIHSGDMKIVKSSGDFDIMCRYTESIMADTGSAIGKGEFPIAPYQLNKAIPCSYCDYKTVCRFDNERNQYNYLSALNEANALEKCAMPSMVHLDRLRLTLIFVKVLIPIAL